MDAIKIRTTVESTTLEIPELARFVGRAVEVIVLVSAAEVRPGDLAGERPLGRYRGQIRVAPDFDSTPDDVLDLFEGESR